MSSSALFATERTLTILLPELLILAVAIAMMTVGAFLRLPRRTWALISAATLLVAFGLVHAFGNHGTSSIAYGVVAVNDALSWYGRMGLALSGLLLLALAHDQVDDARASEFFGALLMIHAGAMMVTAANEIVFLFVGLELVSIPTYLLLYLPRRNPTTQEAATKYFYLSIFSSALLLFGLAYLYGIAGVGNLKALAFVFQTSPEQFPKWFGLIAVLFVLAGLGFRVAAVPFHFYAPDVYQGSPTVIAALLAWIPKAVGFLAMIRVLTVVLGGANPIAEKAVQVAWVIAVATMTLGNTVALLQSDLKRLLAYSSIAHAGYLMMGVAAGFVDGTATSSAYLGAQGIVFYLAAYALMTLGVFGTILLLDTPERPVSRIEDLTGLARTNPFPAFAMALCLFSLAGVPPLAGFWGKLLVFASALSAGSSGSNGGLFLLLAVLGCINAAIGAYYYLRIVVVMYLRPPVAGDPPVRAREDGPSRLAVALCAGLSLLLGLLPGGMFRVANESATAALTLPAPPSPNTPQPVALKTTQH